MSGSESHSRKTYWVIFAVLAIFTILEIAIAEMDISRSLIIIGLIGMAVAKAACVLLWYMHLISETKVLKYSVILPFLAPALYAVVLIAESLWRSHIARFLYS